jgi:hypothetical protein
MVNKKGFIRTLEAVIAVVMILGLLFFLIPEQKTPTGEVPAQIKQAQSYILEEISLNSGYRNCITSAVPGQCQGGCLDTLNIFITKQAPLGYATACEVCQSSLSCADLQLPIDKSIYTDSIFIAKQATTSRVLRVYFYEQ